MRVIRLAVCNRLASWLQGDGNQLFHLGFDLVGDLPAESGGAPKLGRLGGMPQGRDRAQTDDDSGGEGFSVNQKDAQHLVESLWLQA